MSNHLLSRKEVEIYRKYNRRSINEYLIKESKDNEKYKKMAKKTEWIKKIKVLISKGCSVQKIYAILGSKMKNELGYDPLKTIEYYFKISLKEQNTPKKQDEDLER